MLGDGELVKRGQKNIYDFQRALRIILIPSPFRTPTCLSQKNLDSLHNALPHFIAQSAKNCYVTVMLFLEEVVRNMHMYICTYLFV